MYENYNGKSSGLAPVDVQAIQALYGPRVPDAYEGATGDDSFATAAPLTLPDIQGDISSPTDLDYYRFTVPTGASGTMTVSVQSSGVSLLTPKLSVFDGQQNLIATSTATGLGTGADALHALAFNGDVTITLNNVRPGQTYYFKVESGTQDVFGVGAYRLKTVTSLSSLLQIGYLDAVYSGAAAPSITVGARANDTLSTAVALTRSTDNGQDFLVKAAISDPTDVDYYSVVVPGAGGAAPQTLNASVTALGGGLYPTLTVYDQTGQQVNATILTNSPGDYVVQVANAAAGATYYVEVSAMPGYASHSTGGYSLAVSFSAPAAQLNTLASNTLSNSSGGVQQDVFGLKIAETELAHFVLSANTPGASVATGVRLQIFDNQGTLVLCLDAFNGQTVSADVFLKKGVYTMSIVAATKDGSPLAPTTYLVQTKSLTDPLNPVPIDPTNPPPTDSTTTTSPTPAPPPSSPWDPTTYTMSYPMYG
jgi:hypothetical protein